MTDVRVYSNAPATELTLGGRSLGIRSDCPDRVCVWEAVALAPGTNAVVARGRFAGGTVIEDRADWTLSADAATHIRIDAGTIVAAPASARFGSDAFFIGGTAGTLDKAADYGKPAVAATIAGTTDSAVAATYRQGRFRYRIPLADGRYRVTLTFVEPVAGAGERLFGVTANGNPIVEALDIAATAGGKAIALRRTAEVTSKGGTLDLAFDPIKGEAVVSAIEISEISGSER